VSIRALILELMARLRDELDLTYLFITHDLAVSKYISDRIAIMYLGKIVESGPKDLVFSNPRHPYTLALLSAIPIPDPKPRRKRVLLKGEIPSPINPPPGCRLHPRCPRAKPVCSREEPELVECEEGHLVACHLVP
ncbi:TPA: ABC transporter ATP-binding protein, partial [Candidatus Bathyarchaeota archaeon]|nr:ABC transporter ATP-binding protein [Candidatus Bathyarchaeota archaeon]